METLVCNYLAMPLGAIHFHRNIAHYWSIIHDITQGRKEILERCPTMTHTGKWQKKATPVLATQWWERGDHPEVYSWSTSTPILSKEGEHPIVTGEPTEWAHSVTIWDKQHQMMIAHDPVFPGYWIVEYSEKYFRAYSPEDFHRLFEPDKNNT